MNSIPIMAWLKTHLLPTTVFRRITHSMLPMLRKNIGKIQDAHRLVNTFQKRIENLKPFMMWKSIEAILWCYKASLEIIYPSQPPSPNRYPKWLLSSSPHSSSLSWANSFTDPRSPKVPARLALCLAPTPSRYYSFFFLDVRLILFLILLNIIFGD